MKYLSILVVCLVAMVAAKPSGDVAKLLKDLLEELEKAENFPCLTDNCSKDIGAVRPFGSTVIGSTYVELKIIRDTSETNADRTSHKPRYSLRYGRNTPTDDPSNKEYVIRSLYWSELPNCSNGAEGCIVVKKLKPNTKYWFKLEVELYDGQGYYSEKKREDIKYFTTRATGNTNALNFGGDSKDI